MPRLNGRPGHEPWLPDWVIYAVGALIAACLGTMLFVWQTPAAVAAAEASLGNDPMAFLRSFIGVLLVAYGLLVLKRAPPVLRGER